MARYVPNELELWLFVPSTPGIANLAAPDVSAELSHVDTIELTGFAEVSGFTFSGSSVEAPSIDSKFVPKLAGTYTAPDGQIVFYKDDEAASDGEAIRAALPLDAQGFICRFFPEEGLKQAVAAASICDVWPVRVLSNSVNNPVSNEPAKFTVQLSFHARPHQDAVAVA